jgi:hypothetical protein
MFLKQNMFYFLIFHKALSAYPTNQHNSLTFDYSNHISRGLQSSSYNIPHSFIGSILDIWRACYLRHPVLTASQSAYGVGNRKFSSHDLTSCLYTPVFWLCYNCFFSQPRCRVESLCLVLIPGLRPHD